MCMTYNFMSLGGPVVGVENKDGTQTIAVHDRKGIYRTYLTSPEKVDEFIKTYQKGKVKEGIALGSGATAGVIIGAIIGALVHKKLPTSVWDKWLGGLCGGAAGLLAGGVAGPFRGGKNIDKAVAKLTDGAPQVQPEPAQPQAAPQIPQTTAPAGFNNLLKQAQQQKI